MSSELAQTQRVSAGNMQAITGRRHPHGHLLSLDAAEDVALRFSSAAPGKGTHRVLHATHLPEDLEAAAKAWPG